MATPDRGTELLAPLVAAPERSAIFLDFDGTLAEIVDHPVLARPVEGAREVLARLARRFGAVCVVSGRPASFLVEWLDDNRLRLAGLYGMEAVEGGRVVVHPDVGRWRNVVEEAAHHTEVSGPRDATIERKGLSVTLHFRRAPHAEDVVRAWAEVEAARTGLVMHPARMSYELRPPTGRDKGTVVREIGAGRDAVCFIGDDRGDLPAFDALDDLAASGARTVRVAVMSSEAPPELLQRADIRVDGPKGVVALLETLTESVGA